MVDSIKSLRGIFRQLPLLPDDKKWLRHILTDGEPQIVRALLLRYADIFLQCSDAEPVKHRKDNAGRRAANTWIRQEIDKMRHEEPETVKNYRRLLKEPFPKCCHTCENYDLQGVCLRYGMEPPEDFAAKTDACADWVEDIPF